MSQHPNHGFWKMSSYLFDGLGKHDTNKDDGWHVEWPNIGVPSRFARCEIDSTWPNNIVFAVRKGKHCTMAFPDMPISQPVPVVSGRVKALFEGLAPGAVQLLPVRLEFMDKPVADSPYWIMNLLRMIDCVDESRSNWSIGYGGLKSYRSWILDKSRIPSDAMIFRVLNAESSVVVTDEARKRVEQVGITGVGFAELGYLGLRGPTWKPGLVE